MARNYTSMFSKFKHHSNLMSWASVCYDAEDKNKIPVADDLVILKGHDQGKRVSQCNGVDPMEFHTLYASDNCIYNHDNSIERVDHKTYKKTKTENKLNKYGHVYKTGTPVICHQLLADILNDVAVDFYKETGNKLRIYESLRTVDSAFLMYETASDETRELLALPRHSAHNMAMAVDLSIIDAKGRDIERVDHPDQEAIHRNYDGDKISPLQKELRIKLEQSFQRVAYKNYGVVVAPLPRENWDFRFSESLEPKFLKRMLTSIARCTGQSIENYQPDDNEGKIKNYEDFKNEWNDLNKNGQLNKFFGVEKAEPPKESDMQKYCYDNYKPIYDKDISARFGQITNKNHHQKDFNIPQR